MNGRNRSMMTAVFLLLMLSAVPARSQALLDVCASCHPNATCEDKSDGSGKVCNCNYGFVGNGRTHCQDKDECQIGASKICGQHTTCHNTYGSYYCTCLSGYSPSNNMDVFIPNDGTHCQDIDECRTTRPCGEGGQCRNLEGSFDCSCQVGYRVHNGDEPFRPQRGGASCKVVDCGPPVPVEDSALLSVTVTTYGGVARFVCEEGFVWRRGDNSSVCGADGSWSETGLVCEAKCGPVPFLAHSEVVWHNRSVVIHRCAAGYHSWRGVNVSMCGDSGLWVRATLNCIEIKPPIHQLTLYNGNCLKWKAEKYEEDTELYKVVYLGSRDYQRSFLDKGRRVLTSRDDRLTICLRLLPLTNYSISITAAAARFTASVSANTSLTVPPAPVVHYTELETPVPTLRLRRSPNTLDPISFYQIFVLPVEGLVVFDCSSPASLDPSSGSGSPVEYVTAQLGVQSLGAEVNFTVGDGVLYGGFCNAPLQSGNTYFIILRVVSRWKTVSQEPLCCKGAAVKRCCGRCSRFNPKMCFLSKMSTSCCVLWAKVAGTSYVLRVSALCAAASVAALAMVSLGAYGLSWCVNRM